MNPVDEYGKDSTAHEIFDSVVVAYHEALAAGTTPPALDETTLPPDLVARLTNAQACLSAIDLARRARGPADSRFPASSADGLNGLASIADRAAPNSRVGRFQILREVGRGGYGVVFLAFDPVLNRQVALKLPRPEVVVTPDLSRRFLREAQAAGSLAHPNLVAVYEVGDCGPYCFIASAYCDGPNMAQWLKSRTEPVCLRQAAELVAGLADGVDIAHRHGILHRDIKPSNVLLEKPKDGGADGRASLVPKLTDFGLAKILELQHDETRSHALLGTPAYMAPEQASGKNDQISPATDVYGLGAVLYELLTGLTPFRGDSDVQVLRQIVENDPVGPRLLRLETPIDLEAICLKCLEKEPSHRYAGASDLAADLRRFLAGQPTLARPLSPGQRAKKWVRRRPALAGLIAVSATALLMLVALSTAYIWQLRVARQAEKTLRIEAEANAATSRRHEQNANQLLYASRMHLAFQRHEQGEREQVAEFLAPYKASGPLAHLRGFEWFLLKKGIHGERLTLTEHRGEVYTVAFSPTGRELASGGQDGTIKFWDPASGRLVASIQAHDNCVNTLAYSPDGNLLASGSCDHKIRLWNPATRELIDTLEGHTVNVECVAFSPTQGNLLASSGNGPLVNIWDVATREIIHAFDTQHQAVNSLAWRFDGTTLLLMCPNHPASRGIEINVEENREVASYPLGGWVNAGSSRHAEFCFGLSDGTLRRIYDGAVHPMDSGAHIGQVYALAYAPDGNRLASGGTDGTVRLWNVTANRCTQTLTGHSERVQSLAFSPDGQTLASGSFDGTVKLWDLRSGDGEVLTTDLYADTQRLENCVVISPDLERLAVLYRHDTVRMINVDDGSVQSDLITVGTPRGLQFMEDGNVLMVPGLSAADVVDEWDLAKHASRKTHPLRLPNATTVALSPTGDTLAVADSTAIELIDTATANTFRKLASPRPLGQPPRLCLSPDGKDFAVSADPRMASLLIRSGDKQSARESLPEVRAISNGAARLAVGTLAPQALVVVDARSGRRSPLLRHETAVHHAAFAPNAETLATICQNGDVYLWNVRTGQEITRFETVAGLGVRVQFSLDGSKLAAVTVSPPLADLPNGSPVVGSQLPTAHLFMWRGPNAD